MKLVEVGGIEPPSEYNARSSSTCVVDLYFLALDTAGRQAMPRASRWI